MGSLYMNYVAFIRGIGPVNPNMHGHKLKEFFEELGFKNVKTVLTSGNVIFESEEKDEGSLEKIIEENLPRLGFKKITIVKSYDDLRKIFDSDPFKGTEDTPASRLNVTFMKDGKKEFSIIDTVNVGSIKVMEGLEKRYGKEITTRTWKTVGRILKKMEEN